MTGGDGVQVYVYYRVRATDALSVIAAVREMQADLATALPGLHCGVLQRVEPGVELMTLMEIYGHAIGINEVWRLELERQALARLAPWTVGQRHVELFEPCA